MVVVKRAFIFSRALAAAFIMSSGVHAESFSSLSMTGRKLRISSLYFCGPSTSLERCTMPQESNTLNKAATTRSVRNHYHSNLATTGKARGYVPCTLACKRTFVSVDYPSTFMKGNCGVERIAWDADRHCIESAWAGDGGHVPCVEPGYDDLWFFKASFFDFGVLHKVCAHQFLSSIIPAVDGSSPALR